MSYYFLIPQYILTVFFGLGILISLSAHFRAPWAQFLKSFESRLRLGRFFWWVFILPLLIWGRHLYPWTEFTGHKEIYFQPKFIIARLILAMIGIFFAPRFLSKKPWVSLILYLVIGSFMAIDWGLALEADWSSNLFSLIYLTSGTLSAMALILLKKIPEGKEIRRDLMHFFLTIVIFWLYLEFSQFLIVWMGNLPHEVTWYVARLKKPWVFLFILIPVLKVLPLLFVTFFKEAKVKTSYIKSVSLLILLSFVFEIIWYFVPTLRGIS